MNPKSQGLARKLLPASHRALTRLLFLGWATFLLAGAPAESAPKAPPACKKAWSKLIPKGEHQYRFGQDGYADYLARIHRKDCVKPWTILVYMAADNDLEPYAFWNLYEMEAGYAKPNQAGSTVRTDLLVHLDTAGEHGSRRLHVFQSPRAYDAKLKFEDFKDTNWDSVESPVVEEAPESSQPEDRKLREFLEWGMREYPSERYFVIVWGHGQGWATRQPKKKAKSELLSASDLASLGKAVGKPGSGKSNPYAGRGFGGLAFDDASGTYLDIPSLRRVLAEVSEKHHGGKPVDMYASDACLMQMAEVATELSDSARFIAGSTQVQDFFGMPYRRMMFHINSGSFDGERERTDSDDEAYLLALMLPKAYRETFTGAGLHKRVSPEGLKSYTTSAISSAELQSQLLPEIDRLGGALEDYLREDPSRDVEVQFVIQNTPSFLGGAQDLAMFTGALGLLLRAEAEKTGSWSPAANRLKSACDSTRDALLRAVLGFAYGNQYADEELALLGVRALSIWLPVDPADYEARIKDFQRSRLYHYPGEQGLGRWNQWLATLYGAE